MPAQSYDELKNERHQAFIDAYLQHGDRNRAYLEAGYTPSRSALRCAAYKLYRQLQGIIQDEINKRIGHGAVLALSIIKDLMRNAKSETVRLQAAQDYLRRAGYDKPLEQHITLDDQRTLSNEELNDEIEALIKGAFNAAGPRGN